MLPGTNVEERCSLGTVALNCGPRIIWDRSICGRHTVGVWWNWKRIKDLLRLLNFQMLENRARWTSWWGRCLQGSNQADGQLLKSCVLKTCASQTGLKVCCAWDTQQGFLAVQPPGETWRSEKAHTPANCASNESEDPTAPAPFCGTER